MISNHQIKRFSKDGLTVETWTFCFIDFNVHLDSYTCGVRQTKRHKPRIDKRWERLHERRRNIDKPAVPKDVNDELLIWIQSQITPRYDIK